MAPKPLPLLEAYLISIQRGTQRGVRHLAPGYLERAVCPDAVTLGVRSGSSQAIGTLVSKTFEHLQNLAMLDSLSPLWLSSAPS